MRTDAIALAELRTPRKGLSMEILNHPELIHLASGLDPYTQTPSAYLKAYESLGIDFLKRVPLRNAPPALKPGETRGLGNGYMESYLGLYNSVCRHRFPYKDVEDFWHAEDITFDVNQLLTPEPHPFDKEDIEKRMEIAADCGLYYYRLYTTLFMWAVEILGWEVFMIAAALDPDGFDEKFLEPAFQKSLEYLTILSDIDNPFVFCHDDLADHKGPIFHPSWYEKYIFPKYERLWEPAKKAGKKLLLVADGNMGPFLADLRATGIDGVVFENPATDFDLILEHFSDKIIIGGIDAKLVTFQKPNEIRDHVLDVDAKIRNLPGFVMSICGGIHGNIPLENLEAYFDTRVEIGYTKNGWRKISD
jgi:hypothetical protein